MKLKAGFLLLLCFWLMTIQSSTLKSQGNSSKLSYREVLVLQHEGFGDRVAWHPDGKTIATAGNVEGFPEVYLWNQQGERLASFGPNKLYNAVTHLVWSRDGDLLTLSYDADGYIHIWDVIDPKNPRFFKELYHQPDEGNISRISALVWHPLSEDLLLSVGGTSPSQNPFREEVRSINIWNVTSGELLHNLDEHGENILVARYSPDALYLATYSMDKDILLWDAKEMEVLRYLRDHKVEDGDGDDPYVGLLTWAPDSAAIAWANCGFIECSITFNQLDNTEISTTITSTGTHQSLNIIALEWNPQQPLLASAGTTDSQIKFWNTATGNELETIQLDEYISSLSWSPDGTNLAATLFFSGKTIIWEITYDPS